MRFSTVVAGLVFGLGAAAIRVGPVQAGQVAAEVCTDSRGVLWRNERIAQKLGDAYRYLSAGSEMVATSETCSSTAQYGHELTQL